MDLGLSEQHEILKRTARQFLQAESPLSLARELEDSELGYSPELWKKMAGLGWLGLGFPTRYGGAEGSLVDQVVLFEEIGRAMVAGPILPSSVLVSQVLIGAGTDRQKQELLPFMAQGKVVISALLTGEIYGSGAGLQFRPGSDGNGYVLNGTILFVPFAQVADYILCAAQQSSGEPQNGYSATVFLVDTGTSGLTVNLLESVAGYKQHEVLFQEVQVPGECVVGNTGQGQEAMTLPRQYTTVVQCAEMVGRAQKILEMVVEYSKTRIQFGRPIGSFQAIQHQCADLRVAVDAARLLTYQAGWKLEQEIPCAQDVAMAKACAGSVSRQAVATGHGIFAGIAFTVEHDMQLFTMRSKIAEANLGDTDFHLATLGERMRDLRL